MNPLRQPSNPVMHGLEGRTQQVAEYHAFPPFKDKDLFSLCGRCQACFPAFTLGFTWGVNKQTKVTVNPTFQPDRPRPDWCYIFDSIILTRKKIIQVGAYKNHTDFMLHSGPPLTYTSCYWSSQYFGPTRRVVAPTAPMGTPYSETLNSIPNLQWFLFYGNTIDCITGTVPEAPADLDTLQFITTPLEYDSRVSGSGDPTQEDGGDFSGDIVGWCLALLRRRIKASDPGDPSSPLIVTYSAYAMYQVDQPPEQEQPIFDCRGSNNWKLVFNPLNLPTHSIETIPTGP